MPETLEGVPLVSYEKRMKVVENMLEVPGRDGMIAFMQKLVGDRIDVPSLF